MKSLNGPERAELGFTQPPREKYAPWSAEYVNVRPGVWDGNWKSRGLGWNHSSAAAFVHLSTEYQSTIGLIQRACSMRFNLHKLTRRSEWRSSCQPRELGNWRRWSKEQPGNDRGREKAPHPFRCFANCYAKIVEILATHDKLFWPTLYITSRVHYRVDAPQCYENLLNCTET